MLSTMKSFSLAALAAFGLGSFAGPEALAQPGRPAPRPQHQQHQQHQRPQQYAPRVVPGVGQPAFPSRPTYPQPGYPGGQPTYPGGQPGYPQPSYPQPTYPQGTAPRVVPGAGQPAFPPTQPWRLGIDGSPDAYGVRIDRLYPYSAAERMGLEVGDVLVQINGRPVRDLYELGNVLAASGGYARVLTLDNRTGTYQWVEGYLQ